MQLERQKARRLKKKFANTKSVGSAPAPAAPSTMNQVGASVSQAAANAGNAVKGFFGNLGSKPQNQFSGPSYRVKGGELADIPVSGQVMKPAANPNSTASKVKTGLASFGQKVSGAVSSAYSSVSSTVQQHTASPTPAYSFYFVFLSLVNVVLLLFAISEIFLMMILLNLNLNLNPNLLLLPLLRLLLPSLRLLVLPRKLKPSSILVICLFLQILLKLLLNLNLLLLLLNLSLQ